MGHTNTAGAEREQHSWDETPEVELPREVRPDPNDAQFVELGGGLILLTSGGDKWLEEQRAKQLAVGSAAISGQMRAGVADMFKVPGR